MMESWFWKALLSIFLIAPGAIGIPFFNKNFGIRPEVFIIWYFLALVCGTAFWSLAVKGVNIWPSTLGLGLIICIGLVFAVAGHILLFEAIVEAPNPGMALSVHQANSVIVFFLSLCLAYFLPRYFDAATFGTNQLFGVIFVFIGVVILGISR